CQHSFGAPYSF
nr:immunoglobulin light chain junction region [Macaca mulatta]